MSDMSTDVSTHPDYEMTAMALAIAILKGDRVGASALLGPHGHEPLCDGDAGECAGDECDIFNTFTGLLTVLCAEARCGSATVWRGMRSTYPRMTDREILIGLLEGHLKAWRVSVWGA